MFFVDTECPVARHWSPTLGEMSAVWFQFFLFESEMWATQHLSEHDPRKWCTPRKLVYHLVVVWIVWNNYCLFVWHFAMTTMSSFWRYLFFGIALMAWPKTWPVGSDHCSVCYCFHGNLSKYDASLHHYLDTHLRAEKCVIMCDCNK